MRGLAMSDTPIAVFPGTFDPIHLGHLDVLEKVLKVFNKVIVAVGENPSKTPMFDLKSRLDMIHRSTNMYPCEVTSYTGMLSRFCSDLKVDRRSEVVIVRGVRSFRDLEQELVLAQTMKDLGRIQVMLIPTDLSKAHISSSMFREIASSTSSYQDLRGYVPTHVIDVLREMRAR